MLNTLRSIFAARRTRPDKREAWNQIDMIRAESGEVVTNDKALQFSVVWACVRVIAESISQLPWRTFRKTDRGRERAPLHPADRLLGSWPNDEQTPAVWRELLLRDVLLWGNAYNEIERDLAGRPIALHPIRPDLVTPTRLASGELYYFVRQAAGDPIPIPAVDMFHLRGLGDDLAGYSPIRYGSGAIGLGLAEQSTQSAFMRNDGRPLGLLTPVGPVRPEAKREIEDKWHAMTGGKNRYRTIVLPQTMQYTALGMPNTDAQMLESRKFTILEICRLYRVPPHKVAELQFATFSNIVHQSMEFVQDTLGPWLVKLEQEADRKLIGRDPRLYTKIDLNGLLRGDFATRVASYQMMIDRGIFSINDVLELEDRNTIGPDGDKRFVPLNMQLLENAGEEPDPPAPPPAQPAGPPADDPAADDSEDVDPPDAPNAIPADLLRPFVVDAVRRILARAADRPRGGVHAYASTVLRPLAPLMGPAFDTAKWATRFATTNHNDVNDVDDWVEYLMREVTK